MSVDRVQGKVRAQLWDSGSSAWIDAPGDATNGLKVQGPLTDTQLRASAVPVSGTFYQATQPVSLASAPTTAVTGPLTDSQLRATAVPVSNASLPLPSGAATDSNLNTLVGSAGSSPPSLDTGASGVLGWLRKLYGAVSGTLTVDGSGHTQPVSGTFWQSTQPVSLASAPTTAVTGPVTDTQLRASAVPVSLASAPTTAVTGPLTDTQLRATAVPVSGPLTDTQLRATAVPVSGTVTASGPLTDTQLRATAVPVSGPLTDTQIRASALPVSGTVAISNPTTNPETGLAKDATLTGGTAKAVVTPTADATSTGSFTANGDSLVAAVTSGMTMWGAYVQGTYATGATITFEASVDGGTTYTTCQVQRIDALAVTTITSVALTANLTRFYQGPIPPGATHVRMRVSAWASPSGTINARIAQRVMPVAPYAAVLQGAANPLQTQIGDGTSQATVIPRGTAEASTDKGISVVPLAAKLPTYQVATTEITSATATGVKENLTLWHPNTVTKDVFITEIGVNTRVVQTAGTFAWELQFISAEGGTPGGTTLTAQPLNLGDAASGLTIRQVVTGAPTATGQIFQHAGFALPAAATPFDGSSNEGTILFRAESPSEAITLRNGQSEGLRITQNIAATLTTAPIFSIYVRYIERA